MLGDLCKVTKSPHVFQQSVSFAKGAERYPVPPHGWELSTRGVLLNVLRMRRSHSNGTQQKLSNMEQLQWALISEVLVALNSHMFNPDFGGTASRAPGKHS